MEASGEYKEGKREKRSLSTIPLPIIPCALLYYQSLQKREVTT